MKVEVEGQLGKVQYKQAERECITTYHSIVGHISVSEVAAHVCIQPQGQQSNEKT